MYKKSCCSTTSMENFISYWFGRLNTILAVVSISYGEKTKLWCYSGSKCDTNCILQYWGSWDSGEPGSYLVWSLKFSKCWNFYFLFIIYSCSKECLVHALCDFYFFFPFSFFGKKVMMKFFYRVDIGTSEPLILDVLINALTQISSE